MVDHSEGIRDILVAYTGYTGGNSPIGSINQVDASNKFFVHQGEELLSETHWTNEQYKITLQASSEANLHTLKNALLNCATDRPSGFIPSATYSGKTYQQLPADVYQVYAETTAQDDFPIAAGQTTDSYGFIANDKINANSALAIGGATRCIILNFLSPRYWSNYSSINLGVYGTAESGTNDLAIQAIVNAIGKYESIVTSSGYEKITVNADTTAIAVFTTSAYNEYTVTDIVEGLFTTFPSDTYIKLLIGAANDQGALSITVSRYDSDGSIPSTQYPYLEFVYDFTATGYPYWIGFIDSVEDPNIGPNRYTTELTLLASYMRS